MGSAWGVDRGRNGAGEGGGAPGVDRLRRAWPHPGAPGGGDVDVYIGRARAGRGTRARPRPHRAGLAGGGDPCPGAPHRRVSGDARSDQRNLAQSRSLAVDRGAGRRAAGGADGARVAHRPQRPFGDRPRPAALRPALSRDQRPCLDRLGGRAGPAPALASSLIGGDFVRPIVLASTSPRRIEILTRSGVAFRAVAPGIDERPPAPLGPLRYVAWAAAAKARAVTTRTAGAIVVAADTEGVFERRIYGKPGDRRQAAAFLRSLSGRRHQGYTAGARLHRR